MSQPAVTVDQQRELAKLLASKFIARPDVYAQQYTDGAWSPIHAKIGMQNLLDHLDGRRSLGHYLLNEKNECKLFAFDIDLEKANKEKEIYYPLPTNSGWTEWENGDPRSAWREPKYNGATDYRHRQGFIKSLLTYQLQSIATLLARSIRDELDIPVAVSYSGSKGLHVYGFTGLVPAVDAREGAMIALEATKRFESLRGNNFFRHKDTGDPQTGYPQLSIEVFPKQDTLSDGKKLGNLMRLPCGRNLNGGPAYFVDMRDTRYTEIPERNAIEALTISDPWAGVLSE